MRISDWSSDVCSSDLLWHAREGGEFVHDPPQVANLAHDGAGQAREGGLVARHLLGIAALQPFGGKLDRGQRVLDLMRDTPRHVGPGGAAPAGKGSEERRVGNRWCGTGRFRWWPE